MVTDNEEDIPEETREPTIIETFIYPEEAFFDPITGLPATGSPLPEPVPITIVIPPGPLPPPGPPPPPPPGPPPGSAVVPTGNFVTPDDLARSNRAMLELMRGLIRDALEGLDVSAAREGMVTQDTFQAVVRDFALVRAARVELVDAMFATQAERFQGLESLIATTLSEIEDRRLAEIAEVEEATGFSPVAIFTGLGDFMRDPVNYVLDKSRDQILEELSIGLNR